MSPSSQNPLNMVPNPFVLLQGIRLYCQQPNVQMNAGYSLKE